MSSFCLIIIVERQLCGHLHNYPIYCKQYLRTAGAVRDNSFAVRSVSKGGRSEVSGLYSFGLDTAFFPKEVL